MKASLLIPEMILGDGAVSELGRHLERLGVFRPLLVTDQGLVNAGHVETLIKHLGPKVKVSVFDTTRPNPTALCVDSASSEYAESACDSVIALGGGSVIDTAKLTAVVTSHGGSAADYLGRSNLISGKTCPIVAIPTTAGTGSEASPDAGIHPTDRTISSGISSRYVIPRLAICDPELTKTQPIWLVAASGIDALSHCIEGYLAAGDDPVVDMLALSGIRIIIDTLPNLMKVSDPESRAKMMIAAFYGGVAIGKGLGPAHAIAISCGDQDIHHGVLSGLGLLATCDYLERELTERCLQLKQAMGIRRDISISQYLRDLLVELNLPTRLYEVGFKVADQKNLARNCATSHFNETCRIRLYPEEFELMIETSL